MSDQTSISHIFIGIAMYGGLIWHIGFRMRSSCYPFTETAIRNKRFIVAVSPIAIFILGGEFEKDFLSRAFLGIPFAIFVFSIVSSKIFRWCFENITGNSNEPIVEYIVIQAYTLLASMMCFIVIEIISKYFKVLLG